MGRLSVGRKGELNSRGAEAEGSWRGGKRSWRGAEREEKELKGR